MAFYRQEEQKIEKECLYKIVETIKSSKDIDIIFNNGKSYFLPFLRIVIYKDLDNQIKGEAAFIAGKKHGNAVWRSKSKRRLREIYKELNINTQHKTLLIANKKTLETNYKEIIIKTKEIIKKYENN